MYAIVLAALVTADVTVAPKAAAKSEPPRIITAQVKGDRLVSRQVIQMAVLIKKRVKVKVNGKDVEKEVTVTVPEWRELEYAWDLKKGKATTAGGKNISLDDLKKRLGKPALVVISVDGKAIGAEYLKLFAAETIVVVAPRSLPVARNPNKEESKP